MKVLLTLSIAFEVESEDELAPFMRGIDDGIAQAVRAAWGDIGKDDEIEDVERSIDFYGATLSIKQPLLENA